MKETRAHAILKKLYPSAHFQRLEGWVGGGVFDLNGCHKGVESWIELKQADRPKTSRGKVSPKVQPGQVAWEALRRQAGGRTFIILMLGSEFYLFPGWFIKELAHGITMSRVEELRLPNSALFEANYDRGKTK